VSCRTRSDAHSQGATFDEPKERRCAKTHTPSERNTADFLGFFDGLDEAGEPRHVADHERRAVALDEVSAAEREVA